MNSYLIGIDGLKCCCKILFCILWFKMVRLLLDILLLTCISQHMFPAAPGTFNCPQCDRMYKHKRSLAFHIKNECQKEAAFLCSQCPYKTKIKSNFKKHLALKHWLSLDLWLYHDYKRYCLLIQYTIYQFY